jgi:hypothetical protein
MKLIINVFCVFFFITCCSSAIAQSRQGAKEKIEALKIAYITTAVDLSTAEAQQFWPVYNEAEQKRKDLRRSRASERKNATQNFQTMSDKEAELFIDKEMEFKQKDLDIQKELHSKLKKVLSAKKIARLYKAEVDFQRKVLQDLDERPLKGGK